MFECVEIVEQVYEVVTPSEIATNRSDANRDSHDRKHKGGEAASPINPEKGHTGKCRKYCSGHLSDRTIGDKTFLMHDPGHSAESVKYLRNTLASTLCSGPTKKPALAEKPNVVSPSSLTAKVNR